jgi:gamma-glutamylcyclotransferase (GGCT)/AIG2-like uncharacterized protein YtfP
VNELLAFYGTLMSGMPPRPHRPDLAPHVRLVSGCLIPGRLIDLGPYPALVPGDGVVRGELWRTTSADALGLVDAWEGAEYVRREIELLEPAVTAWVYVWDRAAAGHAAISGGDWRSHFGRRALDVAPVHHP